MRSAGFRERERIRRKASRWAANFAAMPPLERQAVMAALLEVQDADGQGGADDGASGPVARLDDSETAPAALGEDYGYYFHPAPGTDTTTVISDDADADGPRQI